MKLRHISAFLLAAFLIGGIGEGIDAYSATKKRSRTRTSQSSGKSRSSGKRRTSSGSRNSKKKTAYRKPAVKPVEEKPQTDSLTLMINRILVESIPADKNPGGLRVNAVKPDKRGENVKLALNENFTYLPVCHELISEMSKTVRRALPDSLAGFEVTFSVGNRPLAYYINKIDKLPEQYRRNVPFVTAVKPYIEPKKGMEGDIIALWHSHGRYFKNGGWQWQRPLLFQSIEDTYTMGYVLPYLVPMLENAGAYVMLPRERDTASVEVIVDNDTNDGGMLFSQTTYREMNGSRSWATGDEEGFIYDLPDFRDTENPFENGTYRQTTTVRSGKPAVAAWYADIPEAGEYAVYVSYKSLPNSTEDARYTVNYSGGSREFKVNQTMGGGTWIYLGTFPFEAVENASIPVVTLTNISDKTSDRVLTADAVKIGGGMGNIARSPHRSDIYYDPSTPEEIITEVEEGEDEDIEEDEDFDSPDINPDGEANSTSAVGRKTADSHPTVGKGAPPTFRTSGLPRYLEGARYWMHWAGAPESVYSPFNGSDDYKDDYTSRGHWVNWLAGGSRVLPGKEGLGIPVDMAFALHSDAGKKSDDSFVGTLGIYYTNDGASYKDGTPRINSRMLTDLIMRQISSDVRKEWEPRWTRRQMWDKSYLEARVPEVPTTLIELLSHQNFADMQYGLDPGFRFTVCRAIYKGMARFMAERKNREVVIQPLPVKDFAIERSKRGHFRLSWQPTPDPAEPTADPTKYIILERTEGTLGFHKIGETSATHFEVKSSDDLIRSYRVIAANEGGLSFPSETLSLRETTSGTDPVLIINGFTRISGPDKFSDEGRAGFDVESDFGVPYIRDISFTGPQTEYRRNAGESFGRSQGNYIDKIIAGNTFDYPALHGESIAEAGYGFVSCSAGAVESGAVDLSDYKIVDLILGRQKTTITGNGHSGARFAAFPKPLRVRLEVFVKNGGSLIISGEKAVSDLCDYRYGDEGREFAENVLGVTLSDCERPSSWSVSTVGGALGGRLFSGRVDYSDRLNEDIYMVQRPDMLQPANQNAEVLMTFGNGAAAGVSSRIGKGKTIIFSIPLETIKDAGERDAIFASVLGYLKK